MLTALRLGGHLRRAGQGELPLGPSPVFAQQGPEAIEPVPFKSDRDCMAGSLGAEAELGQLSKAKRLLQLARDQNLESAGVQLFDRGTLALE
jgi:hypothetical protein